VTFDCYGTLVDWEQGMARALERVAPGQAHALLPAYYALEFEVEAERPFRSYREVLAETLLRAADRVGVRLARGGEHVLAQTLPEWPIFADVVPALRAVQQAGWQRGILSNVDRDLIAGTLEHLPVSFDDVITAEDVQSYKPAPEHFRRFQERRGADLTAWVHVAQSMQHDVLPTRQLGIRCVWINRRGEAWDPRPAAAVLPNLDALSETLEGLLARP